MANSRSFWVVGLVSVGLAVGAATTSWADLLVVDDFDSGRKPNRLGGDFGSWNKDPDDPTQYCRNGFDKANAFGKVGYSLRLDYDVDSPNAAYNGFWSKLQNLDLRPYKQLSFYIKGDASKGYPEQVKVELKSERETGRYLVKGITEQWQKVSIPLKDFTGLSDTTKMTEFVLVFDDVSAVRKTGTVYIDDIAFE
jgi:hypothetical protein